MKRIYQIKYSLDYKEDLASIKKIFTILNKDRWLYKRSINIINADKTFSKNGTYQKLYLKIDLI